MADFKMNTSDMKEMISEFFLRELRNDPISEEFNTDASHGEGYEENNTDTTFNLILENGQEFKISVEENLTGRRVELNYGAMHPTEEGIIINQNDGHYIVAVEGNSTPQPISKIEQSDFTGIGVRLI